MGAAEGKSGLDKTVREKCLENRMRSVGQSSYIASHHLRDSGSTVLLSGLGSVACKTEFGRPRCSALNHSAGSLKGLVGPIP